MSIKVVILCCPEYMLMTNQERLPLIVADSKIPYLRGVLEPYARMRYCVPDEIDSRAVRDADMLIIRTRTHVGRELLDGSPCRFVATATIGYDHIDTAYCAARGIEWVNAPGCNAVSVGQYVLASVLAWARHRCIDPRQLTVGIVGVGHVGRAVERYCRAVGMRVLLNDPPRTRAEGSDAFVPLSELAAHADVITFHTPLTRTGDDATCHLGNAAFFDTLQRKPFLINSSRGAVVDNAALLQALRDGKVAGAAVDCWEGEPHINTRLLDAAFIATPHVAGYSADGKSNATRMAVTAVARKLGVKPDLSTIVPPAPVSPVADVAGSARPVTTAVLATYNPLAETAMLKAHPEAFEAMRNNYGLRREFPAYTVTGADEAAAPVLQGLGFRVL